MTNAFPNYWSPQSDGRWSESVGRFQVSVEGAEHGGKLLEASTPREAERLYRRIRGVSADVQLVVTKTMLRATKRRCPLGRASDQPTWCKN